MTTQKAPRAGTRARLAALGALALAAFAGLAIALDQYSQSTLATRPAAERPRLLLLTSLPLLFADRFGLEGVGSPALKALETRYAVEPIGVADAASLGNARLLMMAQPRAQPAEALVDLDRWVRAGGRVLLLADPKLDWPSDRPLGDAFRPPAAFPDTGLLKRWGLTLYLPGEDGEARRRLGESQITLQSPGELEGTTPACRVSDDRLVAWCEVGAGRVTVIADADFLNASDPGTSVSNLNALLGELATLE